MKILVTGGCGFIGSNLVRRLIKEGHEVSVITSKLDRACSKASYHIADISVYEELEPVFEDQYDVIYHVAGLSGFKAGNINPQLAIRTNILGTYNLLDFASKNKVPQFVNTSSVSVYGRLSFNVNETIRCSPISKYGVSKYSAENYCNLFSSQIGIVNLRLFNVYGPDQNFDINSGIINNFLYPIAHQAPIQLTGPYSKFRDFVYIDDVVDAYIKAMNGRGTFNVCSGEGVSMQAVQNKIFELLNIQDYEVALVKQMNLEESLGVTGSFKKIKKELGWTPKTSFDEGMVKLIESFKIHLSNSSF